MIKALKNLLSAAPPPSEPNCGGSSDEWASLEAKLHLNFPSDYKDMILLYGAGHFAKFFGVANPFYMAAEGRSFIRWAQSRLDEIEDARKAYADEAIKFSTFPKEDGLFPWGYTDNGDTLCWLVRSKGFWPVVCVDDRCSNEFDLYDLSVPDFIASWLEQNITSPKITPANFYPIQRPAFLPFKSPKLNK